MATNNVYLRPDAGDGVNGVRLRPDAPDPSTATSSLVWTGGNDTWAVASDVLIAGAIAIQSGDDAWTLDSTVTTGGVEGALDWSSQNDVWALASSVPQQQQIYGGGAIYPPSWYGKDRQENADLREKLRVLFQGTPEIVREVIEAQSITPFESEEAEERKLREATEAAQIEWQELYLRLLSYQRQEMMAEEEAIVMTMFAVLSR